MKIERVELVRLSVCQPDIEKMNKGEGLRFSINGCEFELIAGTPVQFEKPISETPAKRKKPASSPPADIEIAETKEGFTLHYPSGAVKLSKGDFDEIVKAVNRLPPKFTRKELVEAAKKRERLVRFALKILISKGQLERRGKAARTHYLQARVDGMPPITGTHKTKPQAEKPKAGTEGIISSSKSPNFESTNLVECSPNGGVLVDYFKECRGCGRRVHEDNDNVYCEEQK